MAEEPWSGPSADFATTRAAVLATMRTCGIAYSRSGDQQLGNFEDPIFLAEHGTPPPYNDEFTTW